MGTHDEKLGALRSLCQRANRTVASNNLLDLYLRVLFLEFSEALGQQLCLLLLHLSPLGLRSGEAGQRSLHLHIHPGVNGNELRAAGIGFLEGVIGCLLGNLGTIDADDNRTVLGGLSDVVIFTDYNHRAGCVGDDGCGHRAHHHAGETTHTAGAHDNHGDVLGHLQQHVNRGALSHGVANLQIRGNLVGLGAGILDLL